MYNGDPFASIQVYLNGDWVTVQYSLDPLFKEAGPLIFTLTAYEDLTLKKPLYSMETDLFYMIDQTRMRQNTLNSFVYQLTATDANGKKYKSRWFGWHPDDNVNRDKYLTASDIARREHVRFNYVGHSGWLLKRKNYNAVVESDVDPVTGEPLLDNRSTFGVGKEKGYYDPMILRFSVENREINTDLDPEGHGAQTIEMLRIRAAGFPYIDQHDIIVMKDGKRYIVATPNNKYYPGTTLILLQSPTLRLVPPTDTIYSIETPAFPV